MRGRHWNDENKPQDHTALPFAIALLLIVASAALLIAGLSGPSALLACCGGIWMGVLLEGDSR